MHGLWIVAFDVLRRVSVAAQQVIQFVAADPCEHGGVRDLVAVEVKDRKYGAIPSWIQELVGVPARGQRSGLGLAIADDARNQQVAIVERGAVRVRQGVAKFATLVDRARRLRRNVTSGCPKETRTV
jgi:hypothetical protein